MRRLCPKCGRIYCDCTTSGGWRRSPQAERERKRTEPWRAGYSDREYRAARQKVMDRARGRCESCGRTVAEWDGGRRSWRVTVAGAGVHHVTKLRHGGAPAQASLVLLCPSCHAKADRAR